jgi:hypothetical protein
VGVDHAQVEGCEVRVGVGQSNEGGLVDDAGTAGVDLTSGLVSEALVGSGDGQRSVGQVELVDPGNELRSSSLGVGNVAVVGADGKAGSVPEEVDLLAGEGKRLRAVVGDGRAAANTSDVQVDTRLVRGDGGDGRAGGAVVGALPVSGVVGVDAVDVGLVGDVQRREVLPCETGGVLGARADVRSEESPSPGLGDTSLEPDRHGVKTAHLAEEQLLASLGGDGLSKELANLAGVEVVDEAPDTRLTPTGKDGVEVNELANSGEGVVVSALRRSSVSEHVGQKGGVTLLLLGHELDQRAVLGSETSGNEVLLREDGKTVVEQVKLDPLLVETKSDGLVVEIALDHVARLSTVGTEATSRGVVDGLRLGELAILVVVGGSGVWRQHRDGGSDNGSVDSTSGGGSLAIVRAVGGGTSNNGATLRTGSSSAGGHRGGEGGRDLRCVVELGGERGDGRRRLGDPSGISIEVATRRGASLIVGGEGGGLCSRAVGSLRRRGGGGKAAKDRRGEGGSGVHPDVYCRDGMDG